METLPVHSTAERTRHGPPAVSRVNTRMAITILGTEYLLELSALPMSGKHNNARHSD